MIEVGIIPPDQVSDIWPVVEPLLAPAVDRGGGRMSMNTVRQSLTNGTHLLWVAHEGNDILAAFITRVAQYPLRRMLVVESLGGRDLGEWVEKVNQTLLRFASDNGCSGIELYGRPGWVKALKPYGWKHSMVVCEIELDHEAAHV